MDACAGRGGGSLGGQCLGKALSSCKQLRCSPGTGKRRAHDQKFIVWSGKAATVVSARKAVTLSCLEGSRSVKTYTKDVEKESEVTEGRSAVKMRSQEQF